MRVLRRKKLSWIRISKAKLSPRGWQSEQRLAIPTWFGARSECSPQRAAAPSPAARQCASGGVYTRSFGWTTIWFALEVSHKCAAWALPHQLFSHCVCFPQRSKSQRWASDFAESLSMQTKLSTRTQYNGIFTRVYFSCEFKQKSQKFGSGKTRIFWKKHRKNSSKILWNASNCIL